MLTEQEEQFLDAIYAKYAQTLLRCSQSILLQFPDSGALAEECVQETFVVAMRKMKKLLRHEAPEAWLKDTCRKISLTKRRNLLIHARILGTLVSFSVLFDTPDPMDDIEAWTLANDLASVKQSLLSKLSDEERAVYRLFYEQHLSMKDTAKELNISKDAVRGALQRIKKKGIMNNMEKYYD